MNIAHIEYSICTKSLDIFVSGCKPPYCQGCCNPELISFKNGKGWLYVVGKIRKYLIEYDTLIDNIFLVGGSFNHQDVEQVEDFLNMFTEHTDAFKNKKIWLFAREELDEIQDIFKEKCHYIKCGAFIPELRVPCHIQEGVRLATSNQIVYKKGIDY
jgi:hypothetical protein